MQIQTFGAGDGIEVHTPAETTGSLLVIAGAHADVGSHVLVEGSVVVGRGSGELALHDDLVSRRHLQVTDTDAGYVLRDLGSSNGTRLGGAPLDGDHTLSDGDRIQLGDTILKFTEVDRTETDYLRRIQRLAGTDELTGLPAKHRFDALVADAFRTATDSNQPLSMLMMDMDGLKSINDRHGHQTGAFSIKTTGELIRGLLEGLDEACRFGGDEFCAVLPGRTLEEAMDLGDRIRRAVEDADYTRGDVRVRPTISIGVAALEEDKTPDELQARADRALYRAKAAGRNAVRS